MKRSLIAAIMVALILCVSAVVVGCNRDLTRPDQQAFALDAKVTAADAAVVRYVSLPNCATNGAVQPCAKSDAIKHLAEATTAVGTAMDAYVVAARSQTGTALERYTADVNAALTALTAILAQIGATP
jgi:hypothetical protein